MKISAYEEIFASRHLTPLSKERWRKVMAKLDAAFQPIVNLDTGQRFGVEILVRGWEDAGFPSVEALIEACAAGDMLAEFELTVRRVAAEKLTESPLVGNSALFFNLDERVGDQAEELQKDTRKLFKGLSGPIVTEIHSVPGLNDVDRWARPAKQRGNLLALDCYGTAPNGMRMLTEADPDIIKIDRQCITDIDADAQKRTMVAQLITMVHTLGKLAVAVGIETERELLVLREMGCDLAQGFFIQAPVEDPSSLPEGYPHLAESLPDRPRRQADQARIQERLDPALPINIETPMDVVFQRLAKDNERFCIPVVDALGWPVGIVRERDLRAFVYSAYGKELISSKSYGRTLRNFVVRCPIADVSTPLDQILAIYASNEESDGVLITDRMQYLGFLTAGSIIRATHERMIAQAREENPLTKLPGNDLIVEFLSACLGSGDCAVLVYIDLDNFKPFNDTYGFRQGDRAILMFAELMREAAKSDRWFLGHIGGDDFFIGFQNMTQADAVAAVQPLLARFATNVESLYDAEARERRCIQARDREGNSKTFPLLTASAVLVELPPGHEEVTIDAISTLLAAKKKDAKASPSKLVITSLRQTVEAE